MIVSKYDEYFEIVVALALFLQLQ